MNDELRYTDKIRIEYLRMKASLYSKETKLYALPFYYDKIYKLVTKSSILGLLIIEISKYEKFEKTFSWSVTDEIIRTLIFGIKDFFKQTKYQILITTEFPGGNIITIIAPSSKKHNPFLLDQSIVEDLSDQVYAHLEKILEKKLSSNFREDILKLLPLTIGYSLLIKQPNVRLERSLTYAIAQAEKKASSIERIHFNNKIVELKKIIQKKKITTVFQPIANVNTLEPLGYEALSRGPENTEFYNPEIMFDIAEKGNLVWELERLCREKSFYYLQMLEKNKYLFINNEPDVIFDPNFRAMNILKQFQIDPSYIVLEITERTAIQDFDKFQNALELFRNKGFKIAIDDVGTGYANLQSIALLKPDFIKFDISLIRNINHNSIKKHLVESLVDFAHSAGTIIIAEGVETKEEFQAIKKFKIPYAQGYYLARPGNAFPEIEQAN